MRVVFFGTGEFAVPALRGLVRAGHAVSLAISQPDRPAGRGRKIKPTHIHEAADELGISHVQTADVNAPDVQAALDGEIGVVAAFGQKIGHAVLAAFPLGCVNIHGSLLPKYRGAAPYQWAVMNGDSTTGVTIFQLTKRWDAGPIWARRETPIGARETADELHDRLAELGAAAIVEVLPLIERGEAQPQVQDRSQATRAPKLSRADGMVDWSESAVRIVHRIHGLWSWPTAACTFAARSGKHERLQLARAEVADPVLPPGPEALPGAFCADRTVQCGEGRVRLLEVKPAGGRCMPFDAFANGRQVAPPDRLLPPELP